MPLPTAKRPRRTGLSLIELVIVVLIVGIAGAVAVPRFADSLAYRRARSAAERIRADFELARRKARMASQDQLVQFDAAAHAYTLVGAADLDHPDREYQVRLWEAPYGAAIVSADFGGDADLVFDGHGMPDSGGAVVIQSGPYQCAVTVDASTGQAAVQ